MMQCEFEEMLGEKIAESDYRLIEVVYQWYPVNLDKKTVAELYKEFGMALIHDMLPRADKMKQLEERKRKAEHELFIVKQLMEAVREGYELRELKEGYGDAGGKTQEADSKGKGCQCKDKEGFAGKGNTSTGQAETQS